MKKRILITLILVLLLVVSCWQNPEQGVEGQAARDKEALVGEAGGDSLTFRGLPPDSTVTFYQSKTTDRKFLLESLSSGGVRYYEILEFPGDKFGDIKLQITTGFNVNNFDKLDKGEGIVADFLQADEQDTEEAPAEEASRESVSEERSVSADAGETAVPPVVLVDSSEPEVQALAESGWVCSSSYCCSSANPSICVSSSQPEGTYHSIPEVAPVSLPQVSPITLNSVAAAAAPVAALPTSVAVSASLINCRDATICRQIDDVWQRIRDKLSSLAEDLKGKVWAGKWMSFYEVYPLEVEERIEGGFDESNLPSGIVLLQNDDNLLVSGKQYLNKDVAEKLKAAAVNLKKQYNKKLLVTSAWRSSRTQATLFYDNCLAGGPKACSVPTCPLAWKVLVDRSPEGKFILIGSLAGKYSNRDDVVTALASQGNPEQCSHTKAYAVDVWCEGGANWQHDPQCQEALTKIMIANDFCRIQSEGWHFEFASSTKDRTCQKEGLATYTLKGVTHHPTASSCQLWDYLNHRCVSSSLRVS